MTRDLDAEMLEAHAREDRAALIRLYQEAADQASGQAEAFYLTHAYVFALEAGAQEAEVLRERLIAIGADIEVQSALDKP